VRDLRPEPGSGETGLVVPLPAVAARGTLANRAGPPASLARSLL